MFTLKRSWSWVGKIGLVPATVLLLGGASGLPAMAQQDCGGATVTPDGRILVNKEQGATRQRWTVIATTLEAGDGLQITSVSGNVSRKDGTPEQFLYCQPGTSEDAVVRDDGQGTLTLVCKAVDPAACERAGLNAKDCARVWPGKTDPVTVSKSFFLPRTIACTNPSPPGEAPPDARTVVTFDEREYLVNKAVNGERWTISLAKPASTGSFSDAPALGNVFFPAGGAPLFLYCEPKAPINVYSDSSQVDFRCRGTGTCDASLTQCRASDRWPVIADSVPLSVAFFLPPGGSGQASNGCEYGPELLAKFRDANCATNDQRCVACREAAQALGDTTRVAQSCGSQEDQPCTLPIEGCQEPISGIFAESAAGECFCVGSIPDVCLSCESLRLKAGERCELAASGGRTIVGECQPASAGSGETFCLPPSYADNLACGGPALTRCGTGSCCRADDGDACGAAEVSCDGVCVSGQGGACEKFEQEASCGDGTRDPGEACDDGNKIAGDGCSPVCSVEQCLPGSTRSCSSGFQGACEAGSQTCDQLGAGYGECTPLIAPSAEACGNGDDDDCDGVTDSADSDCQVCAPGTVIACPTGGLGVCAEGRQTCPADGSGFGPCVPLEEPRLEACTNGRDDDCDGGVDGADSECVCVPSSIRSCTTGQMGICDSGTQRCDSDGRGYGACVANAEAEPETCGNGLDDDCDGTVDLDDSNCVCEPSSEEPCVTELPGVCAAGRRVCNESGTAFGDCGAIIQPGEQDEQCTNSLDDDCDGSADILDADCSVGVECDDPFSCSSAHAGSCSEASSCGGGAPECINTVDGIAYCVPSGLLCGDLVGCNTNLDCAPNERCSVDTNCDCGGSQGRVCVPIDTCGTSNLRNVDETESQLSMSTGVPLVW